MYYEINANIVPQVRLVDRAVLEPPYVHRKRQPDEFILYVMKSGVLYLKEGRISYTLKSGDALLLDPDFMHEGMEASNCEYYYIHFHHPKISRRQESSGMWEAQLLYRKASLKEDNGSYLRYQDDWIQYPKYCRLGNSSTYLRVVKLLEEAMEANCNQLEHYKVYCGCRILEAMTEITRYAVTQAGLLQEGAKDGKNGKGRTPDSYRKVQEVLYFLNMHYGERIDSYFLEKKFDCNFDHLNRVFKENIGKTIFVYLTDIRMHHAMELLSTTSMKVAAVARRVGFEDVGYFGKVFRKYTGITPGQYEQVTYQLGAEGKKPQ